ncbi:MAG TPA: CarD family transcriptional regulator, partial [Anaerolineales bacterium]|nr:CarD family transcriptional regulator [Anaerolineales bacterium]
MARISESTMLLDTLIHTISDDAGDLLASIGTGESLPNLGLRRSARLPVLVAVYQELQRPVLLLADRVDHALTLVDELALWAPRAPRRFFPEPNPLFYENAPWGASTRRDRLSVLTSLAAFHIPGPAKPESPPVIIVPARGLMARTMPRRDFLKATRYLKTGQVIQPEALARDLVMLGFEPVNTVIATGQFARRGGIFDLWPHAESQPLRIEFFGDEIDTLRRFDPATQRTVGKQDRLLVSPAREYLMPVQGEMDIPPEEISEFHIPLLHPSPAGILDYLPRETLVFIDDWEILRDTINDIETKAISLRTDYLEEGTLSEDYPLPYLTWTEIQDSLTTHQTIELGPATTPDKSDLAQKFTAGPRFGGRLKPLMDHFSDLRVRGEGFVVVSRQSARLNELWSQQFTNPNLLSPTPAFIDGSLTEGWVFTPSRRAQAPRLHLLTDGEIFGWRRPEPRKRYRGPAEAPEAAYADLQLGDRVVHVDYGIGRFLGLVNRTVEGVEREYLAVEYAQGDQLFVPVHQADRLSRYVGPDSRVPAPSRLGGVEWRNTKKRVKEAVEEVAQDLLDLYAQRQVVKGHAFSPDAPWQQELEASFPYIETEDQLRVLAEVKQDMESPRPMDRLICGDV